MATVGVCHIFWKSVAAVALGIFIGLPLTETISNIPEFDNAIPDITVGKTSETGDGELNLTLNLQHLTPIPTVAPTAIPKPTPEPELNANVYDIPDYPGRKSYMSYTSFKTNSKQAQLQQQAVTDANGLRVINGRYCIAIGTRFGTAIGQNVDLLLENGTVIPCIVGDLKAVGDTDSTNTFSLNGCCSEFIVDKDVLDSKSKTMGDVSYLNSTWQSPVKQIMVWR